MPRTPGRPLAPEIQAVLAIFLSFASCALFLLLTNVVIPVIIGVLWSVYEAVVRP